MTVPRSSVVLRLSAIAVLLLTVLAGLRVCGAMWQEAARDQGYQMYDNNVHAIDGVRMADDLEHGAIGDFVRHVNERTVWPPMMPLLQVPGFLLFGVDYDTAERQMVVIAFLTLLVAIAAGLAFGGVRGVWIAAGLAAAIAASPFCTSFMVEIMTEGPATLFWLGSIGLYARWVRAGRPAHLLACCLLGLGLFMLKFNYGILWALPVLANELWRAGPRPGALAGLWRERPRIAPLWVAYAVVVGIAALLLLARLLDRGWGAAGFSHAVARAAGHGLAVPVLVVAGLALLPFALHMRASGRATAALWRSVGGFGRVFFVFVVIPTAFWFAVPSHAKGLLHFLAGRSSEIPVWSAEGLLYYPRVFVFEYSPHPLVGVIALALALASLVILPKLSGAERVLPISLGLALTLATLHSVKGDRYFYTIAPIVWMSAALTLGVGAESFGRRLSRPDAVTALAPMLLVAVLIAGPDLPRVRLDLNRIHAPAGLGHVLDAVTDVNVMSHGTVLFGSWNRLAPPLVEWHQRQRYPETEAPPRPKNPTWFDTAEPGLLLDRIAADPEIERVIVLDLRSGYPESSPFFEFENGWQAPVRAALAADSRYSLERRASFDDSGYEMTVYRRL